MLNHILLITCLCIVMTLVLYFFYWNRFIALVIGQAIRLLFWNKDGSSIWIEIGSIHFSLLAGRILAKDLHYHSSNQTIKIVKVQIQWRYWLRRPTSDGESSPPTTENEYSFRLGNCRIQLSLQGVEWFLYNRTASYNNIVDQFEKDLRPSSRSGSHHNFFGRFSRIHNSSALHPSLPVPVFVKNIMTWLRHQLPYLDPKDLLPLRIDIHKAAIILGNLSSPFLLVAEFHDALGTFSIIPSRSIFDLYKQILSLKFQNALIRFVENEDYVGGMTSLGEVVDRQVEHNSAQKSSYQYYRSFMKFWRQKNLYDDVVDHFTTRRKEHVAQQFSSLPSDKSKRNGYGSDSIGVDFSKLDYASELKVLEAPALDLTYYVDVVGEVPSHSAIPDGIYDIGNGDAAPEWGFDVVVYSGFVHYGPWADRQRAELQRTFFPPTYHNANVTSYLRPGDKRIWTALQVFIELREETMFYIPFREASKDWQWDGAVDAPHRPRNREASTMNVSVGDRSSINYVLPMVIGPSGCETNVEVHLDTITVTSSLNDIRLVSAESCRVGCEFPSPNIWNEERTWEISVYLRQPRLLLLRDHIDMFIDLAKDWVSGSPTSYHSFVPMRYNIKLEMHRFELSLYANDQNIVDKPLIKDENALILFCGPHLKTVTSIPSVIFRPHSITIPFTVTAPELVAKFCLPRWSTHAPHSQNGDAKLFKIEMFGLTGSYLYFNDVSPENVEQLRLAFEIKKTVYWAYGWSVRYFMVLRENYLGSFAHFQTLSEYLEKRRQNISASDPIGLKYRPGKANMLQVEIFLQSKGARIILPVHLMSNRVQKQPFATVFNDVGEENCGVLLIPELQLHFKMHDYYMDLSLNLGTVIGSIQHRAIAEVIDCVTNETFIIDGIDITANRLFGPQPGTVAYFCIWEIAFGHFKAVMNAREAILLSSAGNTFRLNLVDLANAPAHLFRPFIDIDGTCTPHLTLFKVTIKGVDIIWKAGLAALQFQVSDGIKIDSNDLGTHQYHKVTSVRIPNILVHLLLTARKRNTWLQAAEVTFDVCLDVYSSPKGLRALTRKQLSFLEDQDRLTGRVRRIFDQLRQRNKTEINREFISHKNGIYLPQPTLPVSDMLTASTIQLNDVGHDQSTLRRFSMLRNLSDSEGDERVSEADRDARLAKTRNSTPVPKPQEDEATTSSGDESDNADLTDGSSTAEDWSYAEDELPQETSFLMAYYSPIVRQYTANWLLSPSLWNGASFLLSKEGAAFMKRDDGSQSGVKPCDFASFAFPDGGLKDEGATSCRIKISRPANVIVTPLLLPAAVYLEEDLKGIAIGPEACIDSLLVDCLSEISPNKSFENLVLSLDLPRATFQFLQHSAISERSHANVNFGLEADHSSSLKITAIVIVDIHRIHMNGKSSTNSSAINLSLETASVVLDTSLDKQSLTSVSQNPLALDLKISNLAVQLLRRNLRLNLDYISVDVDHRGPELATSTSVALLSTAGFIMKLFKEFVQHRSEATRNIIGGLLKLSDQRPVIDPLSTIQPSYLVQTGTPHLLRTNITFRFLYHLQNCLQDMTDSDISSLQHSVSTFGCDDLISCVESRLASLEQDTCSIDQLTSMKRLFTFAQGTTNKTKQENLDTFPVDVLSILLRRVVAKVLAPLGGSSSKFVLEDFRLDIRSRYFHLINTNFSSLSSASQTSLRTRAPKLVQKLIALFSLRDGTVVISPHLMHFMQNVLRVKRHYLFDPDNPTSSLRSDPMENPSSGYIPRICFSEIIANILRFRLQAGAENLLLVMGINGVQISNSYINGLNQAALSMNHSIIFEEIYLQARSPTTPAEDNDQDIYILAALIFSKGRVSAVSRTESGLRNSVKFVLNLSNLLLHVPRSALRLYHFIQEWRADYLPGMEDALRILVSEYNARSPKPSSESSRKSRRSSTFEIHGQIIHFEVSLQVMHGTWLSWETINTTSFIHSPMVSGSIHNFGVQIGSMVLNISSKPIVFGVIPSSRVKLVLPQISLSGTFEERQISTLVLFEFIDLKMKPSHWDTLLAVQQKFGQDFNDLVALMEQTRTRIPDKQAPAFEYGARLKMRGFRIGLEGSSSTVFLDCQDIEGGITKSQDWDIGLSDLALSLSHGAGGRPPTNQAFSRNLRSAFVIVDFQINGSNSELSEEKIIRCSVTKVHAVMQPSSIGEFGDFIDNLQGEMREHQDQRALDLATFKDKAQIILRTLDVNVRDLQHERTSWFKEMNIFISLKNIGFAFPLKDEEIVLPSFRNSTSVTVRAFLFSIRSIDFETHRGETGQSVMKRLSFQFISRFRQSFPDDFAAESHHTRNCLLYPEMNAQLRSSNSGFSRKVWIIASVSGFILDVDSTIPKYVFSLIDVYCQGKERLERLSTSVSVTPTFSTENQNNLNVKGLSSQRNHIPLKLSNFFANISFKSGKIRLYSESASNLLKNKLLSSNQIFQISDDQILDLGAEVFNLPIVSVWAEYRATQSLENPSKNEGPSILIFKTTVHSSQNILRPTLLPFLNELVNHAEKRNVSVDLSNRKEGVPQKDDAKDFLFGIQICFSLQIDKSKLELTCQPDVNVVAGLHWENGGFILDLSPYGGKISFLGSVGGLTIGLKHGFLREDCVTLDALNLTFSVATNMESKIDSDNSISIVLNTEFLGVVRFSRLQDILCFKAVWLDRIPTFNNHSMTDSSASALHNDYREGVAMISNKRFSTVILVRIRKINLEIDLGQSISKLQLGLHESIFRTRLTSDINTVVFYIGDVSIAALGNMSGIIHVSSCIFRTMRRSETKLKSSDGRSKLLEVKLTSGALFAALKSDHQKFLHYRSERLQIEIFDDWTLSAEEEETSRPLQLSFIVACPEIVVAVTISAIPKMLSYMNKFRANLESQQQGAYRESQTFRTTRSLKPDNPLSAVAEAMLDSARSRLIKADKGVYAIRQHMDLQLDLLRLMVFPRTMTDVETAQFIGRDVRARLVSEVAPKERDLQLSFSSMIISKYTQFAHPSPSQLNLFEGEAGHEWPMSLFKDAIEAIIVGLPSMNIHMTSEEVVENLMTTLVYDFHSEFIRRVGMQAFEDIYITLNMSLYSWLTILRKNLAREMDQVRATEDWRASISNTVSASMPSGSQRKKKNPDPPFMTEAQRLSTPYSESPMEVSPSPRDLHLFSLGKDPIEESISQSAPKRSIVVYKPRMRQIERLTMRQLGDATPDVMHPFFMKKAGFNLEDSLPQYVDEYATVPLEQLMEVLVKIYSQQLLSGKHKLKND